MDYVFESERLGFRRWKQQDRSLFASMSTDLDVMRYFPKLLAREEADQLINRFETHMNDKGYTMWAVEKKDDRTFIGFIGLLEISMPIRGKGYAEIGWRLDKRFWKQGYAVEGAKACLAHAFGPLGMKKVYSFTAVMNHPSQTVMKRIGMSKVEEFDHPKLDMSSPLKKHVLYSIDSEQIENWSTGGRA